MTDFNNARPAVCYGTLDTTGELILLKDGETGYWPAEGYSLAGEIDTYDKLADLLNEQRGVTREQRLAMEAGSMFGYDTPIAEPQNHRTTVLIEKLTTVDQSLAAAAKEMRSNGATFEEIKERFQRLIAAAAPLRETA